MVLGEEHQKHIPTWLGASIVIFVTLVVGGYVVYVLNQRINAVATDLQSQINELKKQESTKEVVAQ